jgi:hypothetical protein
MDDWIMIDDAHRYIVFSGTPISSVSDTPTYYESHEKLIDGKWQLHREDGPTVLSQSNDYEEYWLRGRYYSKEQWLTRISKLGRILYG